MRRCVAEAMYGIAAKGWVRLSEIAYVLEESIATKKTIDRPLPVSDMGAE